MKDRPHYSAGSKSGNRVSALWLVVLVIAAALVFTGTALTESKSSETPNGAAGTSQTKQKGAGAQKTQGAKKAMGTTITVTITPGKTYDAPPSVDKKSVEVDKSLGDEVEWVCPLCTGGFDVIFIETGKNPFKDRSFNKAKNKSGKASGGNGTYPYKVIVGGGVLDPDVIIKGG